jgi:hypothetical protein
VSGTKGLRQRPGDQSLPRTKDPAAPGMHDKAIELLRQRRDLGLSRYGATLQPFNGRDTRRDAEEEAADWFVYFLAYLQEQEQRIAAAARRSEIKTLRGVVQLIDGQLEAMLNVNAPDAARYALDDLAATLEEWIAGSAPGGTSDGS